MSARLWGMIISTGLLCPMAAQAQNPPAFRVDVRQVYLAFLPVDKGKIIEQLTIRNVRVFENGEEQKVLHLSRHDEHPIALALLIDSTESVRPNLEVIRNASRGLLRSLFRPEKHDIGLVSEFFFDGRSRVPYVNQNWSSDLHVLEKGIEDINKAGGATPLWDAVYNLANMFEEVDSKYLRVAVIVSDGLDTSSGRTYKQAAAQIQRRQVLVYGISIFDKPLNRGQEMPIDFGKLVTASGGILYEELSLAGLYNVFSKIERAVRGMYYLSYTPTSDAEGLRTIRMEIGNRDSKERWHPRKATIFHRKSYVY